MKESIRLILTQFPDETIKISAAALFLVTIIFFVYWFYNKRRYHKLAHQIPASVVKNYLDSIIQNSTSLKSSLFRGGGLDIGDGIPSVKPVDTIENRAGAMTDGVPHEVHNQKLAHIASLETQLTEKNNIVLELEGKVSELQSSSTQVEDCGHEEIIATLKAEIDELKRQLEEAKASTGAEAGGADLDAITKERDELKERLQEYEIIEDDLANLKRLQQENEQLKKALDAKGGAAVAVAGAAAAEATQANPVEEVSIDPMNSEEAVVEDVAQETSMKEDNATKTDEVVDIAQETQSDEKIVSEEALAGNAETEVPEVENDDKSAEDLLSEFEKMLG